METGDKEYQRPGQAGSGSAENTGNDRDEQKALHTIVSDDERNFVANEAGIDPKDITDVQQTGALSGRDDAAGGSGDDMENTSSNQGTEKF